MDTDIWQKEAALAKSEWDLAQKHQSAPQAGLIFDTLFREGEWVPAGKPVVVLLPPPNIKVRAFVPETRIAAGEERIVRAGLVSPLRRERAARDRHDGYLRRVVVVLRPLHLPG